MVAALQEIVHLFETTRTRHVLETRNGKTLRDMDRLPHHLVDDVNARGLPLDYRVIVPVARPSEEKASIVQIRPIKANALRSV